MDLLDFHLIHPFTCVVSGGTMSGKTTFTIDLIKRRKEIINKKLDKVVYVYCDFQPIFHNLEQEDPNIKFTNDIRELEELIEPPCLIVIDDHMDTITNDKEVGKLITSFFIKKAHHLNCSILIITQNGHPEKFVNINRNTNYTLFFDLLGDQSVLATRGRQLYPGKPGFLLDAYQKSMELRDFGYLFLDYHPARKNKKYSCRSHLDPVPECQVYLPK